MVRIFTVWDFETRAVRLTLEGLKRHPPAGIDVVVPGLEDNGGEILRNIVVPGILAADRVLVVVDQPNANVGFEAGLAYGLGREIALVVQQPELPDWIRHPPFSNFHVRHFDGLDTLSRLLAIAGTWHRTGYGSGAPIGAAPGGCDGDPTLVLCPASHGGQACEAERRATAPQWRTLPKHTFTLLDLPEVTAGVQQLVWTITDYAAHHDIRDGVANATHAVVAGWFAAQILRAHGEQLNSTAMAELRQRLKVFRADDARPVVDVQPLERTFATLGEYGALLSEVPKLEAPLRTGALKPAVATGRATPGAAAGAAWEQALRQDLTAPEVVDLARLVAGDVLAAQVTGAGEALEARAAALAQYLAEPDHLQRAEAKLRRFLPGRDAFIAGQLGAVQQSHAGDGAATPAEASQGAAQPAAAAQDASPAPRGERPDSGPTVGSVIGTAHRLDRSTQWRQVLDQCLSAEHGIFLLHGESRQGLGLFLDRLRYFLGEQAPGHRIVNVPFRKAYRDVESAAEWELRLAHALGGGKPGTAAEHLAALARHRKPFVLLGMQPLRDLTAAQRDGLQEFVRQRFLACLAQAGCPQPVRMLIAVEGPDEGPDGSLTADIDRWALAAEAAHLEQLKRMRTPAVAAPSDVGSADPSQRDLQYVRLEPVTFPPWSEVLTYLRNLRPRPPAPVIAEVKSHYERIVNSQETTFRQLADELDRCLGPA